MTDLSNQLHLPPDPVEGHTGDVDPKTSWGDTAKRTVQEVSEVVSTPTVNTPVAPSVQLDASGVPHMVIPITKKTKAVYGTAAAVATIIATNVAALLPDGPAKLYILAGVGIVGSIGTALGITLPANLPKRSDKV